MSTLNSQQQRAMLELFEQALELPEGERRAHIENAAQEEAVREGALALLARHADSESALKTGMPGALGAMDSDFDPPERLGSYRIVRAIGRGGMGVVYLGERDAGDFDRQVAIKIIRPGIMSDDLVGRFNRERQILAQLDHPHIARLYDGGQTDEGAPFLIMEYVDGQSLSWWIEKNQPTLDARLDLMLQICSAVDFAHQNLVVHRDLTPSNVLVTQNSEAKLIDFGIARPQLSEGAPQLQSAFSGLSLTPGYAAPERQTGAPVTTLSDIFSLGQIMSAMIEPFAEAELQAIADKAAAQAPEDRYSGAALVAQEIRRFRDGRAVNAFSQSSAYRLRKYVRRNVVPVGFGCVAAISLVAGLLLVTDAYRDEARARADAEQRFNEVRELSQFLLFDLYDQLEDVPGATPALNAIADRARQYLDVLSQSEGANDEVRLEAALAYKRLSDVLGTPIAANLGRREEAGEVLDQAIAQLRSLHEKAPQDEAVTRGLAQALYSQSVFAFIAIDDNQLAHDAASEAAALYWQLHERTGDPKAALEAIDAEIEAAQPFSWMGEGARGVAMLKQTLAKMEAHLEEHGENPDSLGLLARTESNLSESIGRLADEDGEDYGEALAYADRAIPSYRRFVEVSDRPDGARRSLAIALWKRALILYSMDVLDRALADLDEAEAIIAEQFTLDPKDSGLDRTLVAIREQKAITLAYAGRSAPALQLARQSVATKRSMYENEPNSPGLLREFASNLVLAGEVAEIVKAQGEACRYYRESVAMYRRMEDNYGLNDYDRDVVMGDLPGAVERTC